MSEVFEQRNGLHFYTAYHFTRLQVCHFTLLACHFTCCFVSVILARFFVRINRLVCFYGAIIMKQKKILMSRIL